MQPVWQWVLTTVLRAAHARQPAGRDILVALATISRDSGHLPEARGDARDLVALAPDAPSFGTLQWNLEAAR